MLWAAIGVLLVSVILLALGLWRVATHSANLELRLEAEEKGWTNTLDIAQEALDIAKAGCDKADALDRELHG